MAEIISRNRKGTKPAPRVDLTPMVDLGFLLITFFIVSNSMAKSKAMPIVFPSDGVNTKAANSKTLNIIVKENNKLIYYFGNDSLHYNSCGFGSNNSIRNIIINKQNAVAKQFGNKAETLVLIKPTSTSKYKSLIDVLDEMLINNVTRYMVLSPSNFEETKM